MHAVYSGIRVVPISTVPFTYGAAVKNVWYDVIHRWYGGIYMWYGSIHTWYSGISAWQTSEKE